MGGSSTSMGSRLLQCVTVTSLLASIARLHIVAIGALGTLSFSQALCGVRDPLLALLSACDWFVVNLLNRVVDVVEDEENGIAGAGVVARNARSTIVVAVAVLLASLAVSAALLPQTLPVRLAFHALGFAYNWRVLPSRSGRKRIKQLAFWKNTASATGFLLTCFALPLVVHDARVAGSTVVVAGAFFFCFELSYEVLYDLRDVDGDKKAGVRTWPVLFGPAAGAWIAVGQLLVSALVVVVGFASGVLPWHIAVMGAAPLLQLLVVAPRLPIFGRPGRVTSSLCVGVTWAGCALLGGYHLWDLAGLPGSSPWMQPAAPGASSPAARSALGLLPSPRARSSSLDDAELRAAAGRRRAQALDATGRRGSPL
jgi:4-hydroxybenzoate polyprenyltransferase